MKRMLALSIAILAAGASAPAAPPTATAPAAVSKALPRSSPEAQGIPSAAILAFLEAVEQKIDAVHSVMLVRHGRVVAEGWWTPYAKDDPHVLFSLTKSFASTGVGMAIAEGKLTLDDGVLAAFPDLGPAEASDNLKAMRLRDLLSMSTGHHAEAIERFPYQSEESLPRLFLALPVAHKPGTHFVYNTPASHMLSAMLQKATGQTLVEYLRPRLFEPLGIERYAWEADRGGMTMGGYGLRVRTEDVARFGQLYLQEGVWRGRRLLPAEWVRSATARQTSNGSNPESDWEQGYGYQFWRSRHGLYRGDGAFGQFCIVMAEKDAVVAITSGTGDMGGVMSLVWEHLLPAMKKGPLPADAKAAGALTRKLASLALRPQEGAATSPLAAAVSGRRYAFPANEDEIEAVALETQGGDPALVLSVAGRESRVPLGHGRWGQSATVTTSAGLAAVPHAERVAASGAWTAEDTFTAKLALHETPFVLTAALRFAGDEVTFEREFNVAFGEKKRPRLVGKSTPR